MRSICILLTIALLSLMSCTKESIESTVQESKVLGIWENPIYKNDTIIFTKGGAKESNFYYINFMSDGSIIERKNAGWCGTPPISYSNYNGYWKMKDSVMQISVEYWGGLSEYRWKLLSVDDGKLSVLRLQEKWN